MDCKHKRIRCTDNRFFCMDCGAEFTPPGEAVKEPVEPHDAPEAEKKPAKRRTKKEGAE